MPQAPNPEQELNDKYHHPFPDPQIINYAADILYRGCDRYRCRGPINKILDGLKTDIFLMQKRFRDNSRQIRCGFKVKCSDCFTPFWSPYLHFGEENVRTVFGLLTLI